MFSLKEWTKTSAGIIVPVLFITMILTATGCKNDEGQGGTGSISGTIIEQFYNDDYSQLINKKPAVDEEIFLLYGEDNALGDRTFTGITGEFRFNYLFPGRYYLYYHSKDSASSLDEDQEKLFLVQLDRGEEADLGDIVKLSTLDYDDGAAVIKGVVRIINYVDESRWPNLVVEDIAFAHEHEVYLTYGNHTYYDERVRTQHDGAFEFRNLIPGDYLIFLYSEDVTTVVEHVVLEYEVTISEYDQVVDLGEIIIEEL